MPLSQAITLDTFPKAQHGPAMALWGIGVMLGPILGPTVGGYMTELYDWRWVFLVVVPFGVIALFGCLAFVPESGRAAGARLDWFGFIALSVAVRDPADVRSRSGWTGSSPTRSCSGRSSRCSATTSSSCTA